MEYEHEELKCALKEYESSGFAKEGCHRVIFWIGKLLLNLPKSEPVEPLKFDEPQPEKLIPTKTFCEDLVLNGKSILSNHDLVHYLKNDPEFFEGCFEQQRKRTRVFVRPEKLLQKLKDYDKTNSNLKEKIREYLKTREQKLCTEATQQLKFTDLDKPKLI